MTEDLRRRAGLPAHVKKVLDALPHGTHPMTQFATGIMALQVRLCVVQGCETPGCVVLPALVSDQDCLLQAAAACGLCDFAPLSRAAARCTPRADPAICAPAAAPSPPLARSPGASRPAAPAHVLRAA